ncbi:MAG: hypothetical protein EOM64_04585 [Erysipelotrichia bacterium]|nr:hypothetical protein [Erysipelotrichia bacterium]
MNYSIVYSSRTGNTAMLAQHLKTILPKDSLVYIGAPDTGALDADTLFIGFWTDKGRCDQVTENFLKTLNSKRIFLFGTAGFGESDSYFAQIISRTAANIDSSNTITGSFMCQGKMPLSVRERYESMKNEQPEKMNQLILNFDAALSHPDQADLDHFLAAIETGLKQQ